MKPGRRVLDVAVAALMAAALVPAVAEAKPPKITKSAVIAGTPQVGQTLVAQAEWDPHGKATVTWQWLRCDGTESGSCTEIPGATTTSYKVAPPDLGKRLRVLLVVRNEDGWVWSLSATTAAVTSPPPPAPEPEPSPSPSPSPQPQPQPVTPTTPTSPTTPAAPTTQSVQTPAPAGGLLDEAHVLRMMDPAPIVTIRGRLTRSGARLTLLTVRSPRGARISVRCLGRGCPARRWAGIARVTRIARLEGSFRAGTRLVITVTKPGRIGKHTIISFRRGAAPTRRDRCLMPGARKPVRCPQT